MSSTIATAQFHMTGVVDAVADAIGDRTLVVQGERRFTHRQMSERSRRLARFLHGQGLGMHTDRGDLPGHEAGQDLMGIYAYNGNEYLEGLLGAFRARVAPFNVNYRYVNTELTYLLNDSGATALLYHAAFAPRVAEIRGDLPTLRVLIQIADGSGNELLDGAVDYESIVTDGAAEGPDVEHSPDDLYVLYTGGTTGAPKGVLWRQHDIFIAGFGGRQFADNDPSQPYRQIAENAAAQPENKMLVLPPLMHGAAQWASMLSLITGQTLVFPAQVEGLDGDEVAATIERERIPVVAGVGDAMARPFLAAMQSGKHDLSALKIWANGGAPLSPAIKQRLIDSHPGLLVADGVGSSETGMQMQHLSTLGAVSTGIFVPGTGTCVVAEDKTAFVTAGHDGIGWLAQRGSVPLGYKGDAEKTAAVYPVIEGERCSVSGDRARHLADGTIELLGRDSVTINSGGEKIFAEEVEMAIASHPAVSDVLVVGRPSPTWGQEVVAVVAVTDGAAATPEELTAHGATTIARYKLPKAIVFVPTIVRSPAGKPDYRWARLQVSASAEGN